MTNRSKADLSLVLVTLSWGISYYLIDLSLKSMGPFTLNSYRFIGAFLVIGLCTIKQLRQINWQTIKWSIILGFFMYITYLGATMGVKYTTLTNAGFLCGLAVIIIPFIEMLVLKRKLQTKVKLSATLCLLGIVLMTLKEGLTINMDTLPGDLLCILCAFGYAIFILILEVVAKDERINLFQIAVFQMLATGIFNLVSALIFEKPVLISDNSTLLAVGFLTVVCTGVAFLVQTIAQKYTEANRVGIIFTLEPVFAAIAAFWLAGERLTPRGYVGMLILTLALFLLETDFKFLINKKKRHHVPKEKRR